MINRITRIPAEPDVIEYLESNSYLIANDPTDGIWLSGMINSYKSWLTHSIDTLHEIEPTLSKDQILELISDSEFDLSAWSEILDHVRDNSNINRAPSTNVA